MRISTRLSLIFSLIASTILILFGILVYFFTSNHTNQLFEERLNQRVSITEKMFLEQETFTEQEFEKIKNQFLHTLPQETEEVIELSRDNINFKYHYPEEDKKQFLSKETVVFYDNDVTGMAKVFNVGNKDYLIIVTAVDETSIQNLYFLRFRIVFLIVASIPLIFLISFLFTRQALKPLVDKIKNANAISASNLHKRLSVVNPKDEIGELAVAFNKLLDRIEVAFEAQKSFISNASHEIKNPLTAIIGEAEIAVNISKSEEDYIESLQTILVEAQRLNLTVNNLLELSQINAIEGEMKFQEIHFDKFVFETKDSFDFINPDNKIEININRHEKYKILANKNALKTVLINVFDNACKFSDNKIVNVFMSKHDGNVILTIKDSGIGISESDIKKVKQPFYRGKNSIKIKGSGIGLSLCDNIIRLNNGMLKIQSIENVGTEISIEFPLVS